MALKQQIVPYEIIVRFNDDGTFNAAQFIKRVLVLDNGKEVASTLLPPEELLPQDNPAFNSMLTDSMNNITALKQEIADLQDQLRIRVQPPEGNA